MKDIYLVNYSVKGIKSLDQLVSLSFYKKTFTSNGNNFQDYNIKGIYGINGSGKTAIVTSVKVFKNLILNRDYLNNPYIQSQLDELMNKKLQQMDFVVDFFVDFENKPNLYRYEISLCRERGGRIVIDREKLSFRIATSRKEEMQQLFEVSNGIIVDVVLSNQAFKDYLIDMTKNLLKNSSISSFTIDYINGWKDAKELLNESVINGLVVLCLFGHNLLVYLERTNDHSDYYIDDVIKGLDENEDKEIRDNLWRAVRDAKRLSANEILPGRSTISKKYYSQYEKSVSKLFDFISIFKRDLKGIVIDKQNNRENYVCDLIMDYGSYKINTEFESTGIKKLIKLYTSFNAMALGDIVFIDELDSNLHDVYLCALLEYLMEHGKGQLCFTTHNIGPMDILKRNKKSIDFLSVNHRIYSWTKNGNYSPANLYKGGMIEGSPFNIDSIDFLRAFDVEEGDEE